jgi:hypothetical protein
VRKVLFSKTGSYNQRRSCSPEEHSIVHALRDERTLFFQLLPDLIESVLLWNCQVPKTTRGRLVIRVGNPWWEC